MSNRTEIEMLKAKARTANTECKFDLVSYYLQQLEPMIPLGGKYDEFQAFCTELETESERRQWGDE